MDKKYFLICLSNLEEKYLCGGISEEDWQRIITIISGEL